MINAINIREYINFLHMKKYSAPATEELKNRWAAVPEGELNTQLKGLYQHWGVDEATASLYEQLFLQSQYLYSNNTTNTQTAIPAQQTVPPPPSKPANSRGIILAVSIVIILALSGFIAFLLMKPSDNPTQGTSAANTPATAATTPVQPAAMQQNATAPESVTTEMSNDDEVNIEAVKALLGAEEDHDMNAILNSFAPAMEQYWDLHYPSREDLVNRYNSVWNKSSGGRHSNIRISKVANNTYDMFADYTYYSLKDQTDKSIKAHVRFVFDNDNKITRTFGVK